MFDDGTNGDVEADDGIYTFFLEDLTIDDEDTYALLITATDAVGNTNDTVEIALQVIEDVDAPEISDISVEYPTGFWSAKPGNDVIISAVVIDDLTNVELVTVDATDIGLGAAEELTLDTVADTYSVTLTVGDVDLDTYTLIITASDSAGNEATAEVDVVVVGALTAYNLALVEGWNLFSVPLIPDDAAIEEIFADILDDNLQIRTFVYEDGDLTEKRWAWDADEGMAVVEDFTDIADGQGYWVETAAAVDLLTIYGVELPGAPGSPPSYEVYEGWNLIGFKSVDAKKAEEYIGAAVSAIFERMYGYDADGVFYILITLATDLQPGQAYWLAVSADGTIYP
jgi:hypothetical protein